MTTRQTAKQILEAVVAKHAAAMTEATVRLPPRSHNYVAVYTGPNGGQVARSTGLRDRDQALALAREWERQARRAREAARAAGSATLVTGKLSLALTQREVAVLMDISERAVRNIERRAMIKLCRHPLLKAIWREYSESNSWFNDPDPLTPEEVEALLGLANTSLERDLLWKVLNQIGQRRSQGGYG